MPLVGSISYHFHANIKSKWEVYTLCNNSPLKAGKIINSTGSTLPPQSCSFLTFSVLSLPLTSPEISSHSPENMSGYSAGQEGGCCRCCCSFIFTSGLTALFLWLSLRGSKPTCSIEDFYVHSLNVSDNSTAARANHTLYFDLRLKNEMKDKGVGYDDINITFFYGGQNGGQPIGNFTVPRFYQGHGKKARRKEVVRETHGVPWEAAYANVSNGSAVTFRVGLATRIRYKILFWFTKRHGLVVAANVDVNGSGKKVNKNGIKLKSGATAPEQIRRPLLLSLPVMVYFLLL